MPDLITSSTTIPAGLFGKTREAVLGLLMLRPDERFHLRQVARLSGAGLGPVQRELAALVAKGVICREQSGRQVYFQARPDCPYASELRQLLLKTSGAAGVIRSILANHQKNIIAAVVFGSMASGEMHANSDVDVLIISPTLSMRDLGGAIREGSERLGREINVNLYRPGEWRERVEARHPFALAILDNPQLVLIGGTDELIRLAEQHLAEGAPARGSRTQAVVRRHRARPSRQRR